MIASLVLSSIFGVPCWDVLDDAIRRRAVAVHPAYVSYDERIFVQENRIPLMRSTAHVDYRDDGLARVADDRFSNVPYITTREEPGPPELGPYGNGRESWLPAYSPGLKVIGDVRSHGRLTCTIADTETYKEHKTYRIEIGNLSPSIPAVRAVWVDAQSHDIWKLNLTGFVDYGDDARAPSLAQFEVELAYDGPYLLVNHVTYTYSQKSDSQYDDLFGEYYLGNFSFPSHLPDDLFRRTAPREPIGEMRGAAGGPSWSRTRDLMLIKHAL